MNTITPNTSFVPTVRPIGDRPLSLAGHLRRTAHLISSGSTTYEWENANRCNCGLLARSITGLTSNDFAALLMPLIDDRRNRGWAHPHMWKGLAADFCPLNPGVPAPELFKQLAAAGMEPEDFNHLEALSNPQIKCQIQLRHKTVTWDEKVKTGWFRSRTEQRSRTEPVPIKQNDSAYVAEYMTIWAREIETYRAAHDAANTPSDAQMEAVENRPLVTT